MQTGTIQWLESTSACACAYTKGEAWLEELLAYLRNNFKYLENYIRENKPLLKVYPLEGTYLAWIDCSGLGMADEALKEFMLKKARGWFDEGTMFGARAIDYALS